MVAKKEKAVHAFAIKQGAPFSKKIAKQESKGSRPTHARKSLKNLVVSKIKCKEKRIEILDRQKHEKKKLKKIAKKQNEEDRLISGKPKLMPLTIDDQKEIDENYIFDAEEDKELQNEEEHDEFASHFDDKKLPKILMTTSEKPSRQMFDFLKEMKTVFSEAHYWPRKQFSLQDIQKYAQTKDYTDIVVFREDRKEVNEIIMIHLPEGPTIHFKITSIKLSDQIHHTARVTDHNPELILNNFNTKVGRRVGRFFATLFPQNPDFRGRRVVTFHNQRDFIFFRHHRYMFQDEGVNVALQEIGPRMTLKVKKVQLGLFDNTHGEIEFEAKDNMYVSRKKVYI